MRDVEWVRVDKDHKGDPMTWVQCSGTTSKGRRCFRRSPLLPKSLLLDENGQWHCHAHHNKKGSNDG